mgnify:CR=1 FL=1
MNYKIHAATIAHKIDTSQSSGNVPLKCFLVMKLTIFLVIAFSFQVTANALAQKIDLDVKNESLENVLRELRRQSRFAFLYSDGDLSSAQPVTISVKGKDLLEVLNQVFHSQPLTYEVDGRIINIVPKPRTLTVPIQQTIRGKVTDSLGNPLQGVTVQVKESGWQTITDREGRYEITGVYPTETLHFRLLSYESYEIPANRPEINVTLRLLYSELQEVDVSLNTGYQNIPKERATGSFVHIDNSLLNRRVSTNLIDRLEGVTSGLAFYRSSANREPSLNIRGRSTIFANEQPLIVLDNFPFEGSLDNINPNDIESITILRDAAAASIWGVRAGNGVIVVTSKKGLQNLEPKVALNSNITIGDAPDLFYIPRISSSDFIDAERYFFEQGYYASFELLASQTALSPVVELLISERDGHVTMSDVDNEINKLRQYDVRKQFEQHFFRKSINQQYSANINGGGRNSSYYFSFGYDNNTPNEIRNHYERFSINASNSFRLSSKLEIQTSLNFVRSASLENNPGIGDLMGGNRIKKYYPYANLIDETGVPIPINYRLREPYIQARENDGFLDWRYNPLHELSLANNINNQAFNRANVGIDYQILNFLSAAIKYQYEKSGLKGENVMDENSYFARNMFNTFFNPSNPQQSPFPQGSILQTTNRGLESHSGRAQLHYTQSWFNHEIAALAGSEIRELKAETNSSTLYGFNQETLSSRPVDYVTIYNNNPTGSSSIPYPRNTGEQINRFFSWYGNMSYTYNSKYILSASGRIDKSNLFGVNANQRGTPLWSGGLKWILDKEGFFKPNLVSKMHLRATYGYNGNIDKSVTALTTAQYFTDPVSFLQTARIINPPNPDLRWERTSMVNVAIDFGLKNSITGSVEYFRKKGIDLIGLSTMDPTTGISSFKGNLANIKGQGFDIRINSRNISRALTWDTEFLFSFATDEVTTYNQTITPASYLQQGAGDMQGYITPFVGRPVLSVYSLEWAGLDPQTGDPRGYLNGEPSIDYTSLVFSAQAEDLIYNGPVNPPVFGGLRNSVSWNGLSLSFNLTYKLGHYFRKQSVDYSDILFSWNGHKDYAMRWQKPGDEMYTNVPSIPSTRPSTFREYYFYGYTEILVRKADHVRLQDINLSYNINTKGWNRFQNSGLQVYLYMNNLGVLWRANKDGIDPDAIPSPYANFLPNPRTFAFGVTANF